MLLKLRNYLMNARNFQEFASPERKQFMHLIGLEDNYIRIVELQGNLFYSKQQNCLLNFRQNFK